MSMPESCPLCSRRNEVHSHSQQPREAPGYSIAQEVPHLRRSVFGKDPFATLYKGGGARTLRKRTIYKIRSNRLRFFFSWCIGKSFPEKFEAFKETLIQSQSPILQEFLYIASSYPSLNSSLFASGYSSLCIKIQE